MPSPVKPSYFTGVPTAQAAVDIFQGAWKSAFPPEAGVKAGIATNFADRRVQWVASELGGLRHRSVLELGPYEGYITYQLDRLGAAPVVAVEASNISYLKCLIAKEILGIEARFLHGDIQSYMDETTERFDLCWATGVLYHQVDPLAPLRSIARVSDRMFVWTHFYDEMIATDADRHPHFDASRDVHKELDGFRCRHYYRSYLYKGDHPPGFSGGSNPFAYWLAKDDILEFVRELGFTDVVVRSVASDHKAGPTMSFLAAKPPRWGRRLRRRFADVPKNLRSRVACAPTERPPKDRREWRSTHHNAGASARSPLIAPPAHPQALATALAVAPTTERHCRRAEDVVRPKPVVPQENATRRQHLRDEQR